MIDKDIDKIVRQKQAETIRKTNKSCSYSKCVNDMLRGVKK